jgi:predicted dehydrogenase
MISVGLIGAGRMGGGHSAILSKMENVKLAGVYDVNPKAAEEMKLKYNMTVFPSISELVNSDKIDLVMDCSPTYCHINGILETLKAGKHLFCEKPLCRTMDEANKIGALAETHKKVFTIGFVRRFMRVMEDFKKMIDSGTIGIPRFVNMKLMLGGYHRQQGNWFTDFEKCGGVILDMLSHHFDLFNWYFGDADRVYADSLLLDPSQPDPADYVSSTLTYRNKVICSLVCGWQRLGPSIDSMEIYGDEGCLCHASYNWVPEAEIRHYPKNGEMRKISTDIMTNGQEMEMKSLIECIANNKTPKVTWEDGYNSMKIALATIQSVKEKRTIKL